MCWVGNKSLEIKVAEEDIKVFKVISSSNRIIASYYRPFKWTLNKKEEDLSIFDTDNIVELEDITVIHKGFHSYSCDYCNFTKLPGCIKVLPSAAMYWSTNIMYCIIPKGSQYVINRYGEIVSDAIIPISVEKL